MTVTKMRNDVQLSWRQIKSLIKQIVEQAWSVTQDHMS